MAASSVLSPKDAAYKNLVVSDKLVCKSGVFSEITTQKINCNTISASQIEDFDAATRNVIDNTLEAGTNVTLTNVADKLVISSTGGGGSSLPPVTTTQLIYVQLGGSDATGDGTLAKPYATIGKALTIVPTLSNTTAPATFRWVIQVGPGTYSIPSFNLKPGVWINGSNYGATRLTVTGSSIGLDPSFTTVTARCGLMNILISGANNQLVLDLQALGGVGRSCVIEIFNVHVNGLVTWKARSSADSLEIWGSQILGGILFSAGAGLIINSYIAGPASVNSSGVTDFGTLDFANCYFASSTTLTKTAAIPLTITLASCTISNNFIVDGATVSSTATSVPAATSIINSGTLTLISSSNGVSHVPINSSFWPSLPQTTKNAIDTIAPLKFYNVSLPTTLTKDQTNSTIQVTSTNVNYTITLPSPQSGLKFKFILVATGSTNTVTVSTPVANTLFGYVIGSTTVTACQSQTSLVFSTTALVGDTFTAESNGTNWFVNAQGQSATSWTVV